MNPNTKEMIKLLGVKKPSGLRDTDKDGVINILDCKPHNPNKQGWIHDKLKAVKERYMEGKAERKEIRTEERKAYKEARITQATRFGKERAKIETERKLKRYREAPSFGKAFMSGFKGVTKIAENIRPMTRPTTSTKTTPTYKYVKKGKHYIRKKVGTTKAGTTKAEPKQQQSMGSMPDINRPVFKW